MSETTTAATWMIVELMGHVKLCGIGTEVVVAGGGFLRVEIPTTPSPLGLGPDLIGFVRMVAPSSVYSLTPITQELAQELVKREAYRSHPVARWELSQFQPEQKALPSSEGTSICQHCLEPFADGGIPGTMCEDCKASADDHREVIGADKSMPCRICETPTRNRDAAGPLCDDCVEDLPPGGGS